MYNVQFDFDLLQQAEMWSELHAGVGRGGGGGWGLYIKGQSQFKRHSFLNYFPFIQTDILLSSAFISFILSAHRVLSTR